MLEILDLVVSVVGEKRVEQGGVSRIAQHHIATSDRSPPPLRLHHIRNEAPNTRDARGARRHVPLRHQIHLAVSPLPIADMRSQTPLVRETVASRHAGDQLNLVLRLKHIGTT